MTEETLRKASDLNDQIRRLQARRKDLLSAQALCWGDEAEVNGRVFKMSIAEKGSTRDTAVWVSAHTAKTALDKEILEATNKINVLLKEFSQL